jgi:uroporphyrinogen-III synthase
VAHLESWDWVVFTSPAGVRAVIRALHGEKRGGAGPTGPRIAVVGRGTGAAVERVGWEVSLLPETFTGEGLLEAFDAAGVELEGARILLPLAEAAREVVPGGLAARGALTTRVTAYRAVPAPETRAAPVAEAVAGGEVDLLTFTSPSTAESFLELVGPEALKVPAVVIGPITASAARELGYRVVAVAEPHSVDGLVAAVDDALAG